MTALHQGFFTFNVTFRYKRSFTLNKLFKIRTSRYVDCNILNLNLSNLLLPFGTWWRDKINREYCWITFFCKICDTYFSEVSILKSLFTSLFLFVPTAPDRCRLFAHAWVCLNFGCSFSKRIQPWCLKSTRSKEGKHIVFIVNPFGCFLFLFFEKKLQLISSLTLEATLWNELKVLSFLSKGESITLRN